jgi:long-chain acyl-CoA synthetase
MSLVIDALSRWQRRKPHAAALQDAIRVVTWSELATRVRDLSSRFSAGQCHCIAIHAENSIDWVIADIAANMNAATVIPVPAFFSHDQVVHLLNTAPVDTLLVDDAVRAVELQPDFMQVPFAAGSMAMYRRAGGDARGRARICEAAKITFTSGSTGEPKGVCLSRPGLERTAAGLATLLHGLNIRRHLCVLPLATLLENVAGIYTPLMLGATIHVLPPKEVGLGGSSAIEGHALRDAIGRTGAESVILLPEMLKELTAQVNAYPWRDCPLRFAAAGGGRVSDADLDAAHAAGIPAYQGYGLSECHSVVALNHPEAARRGSVGRPLPDVSITVATDGELLVGGSSMIGYLGESPVIEDLVRTGDLGHVDQDGFVYVTGRKKNVFITSFGRNVSPEWPEAELLHETAIVQVVVDGEGRSSNLAIIVPASRTVDRAAIAAAVERTNLKLPDYARIGEWLVAHEPFTPANGLLTSTGKPRRDAVLRRYLAERVVPGNAQSASTGNLL